MKVETGNIIVDFEESLVLIRINISGTSISNCHEVLKYLPKNKEGYLRFHEAYFGLAFTYDLIDLKTGNKLMQVGTRELQTVIEKPITFEYIPVRKHNQ